MPAFSRPPPQQNPLSTTLGLILIGYGAVRLLLLAVVLSYASWPRVLFDWNAFKMMLAYALAGLIPIVLGRAIMRRRWWTRSAAPWAAVAAFILDLHIFYIAPDLGSSGCSSASASATAPCR